jgi:hypothetical protein
MLFPLAGGDGAVIKLWELVMILDFHQQGFVCFHHCPPALRRSENCA